MSYLQFCTDDISPCSFAFGRAFHRPPKLPFSSFAWTIVQAQAITRVSCQGLSFHFLRCNFSHISRQSQYQNMISFFHKPRNKNKALSFCYVKNNFNMCMSLFMKTFLFLQHVHMNCFDKRFVSLI